MSNCPLCYALSGTDAPRPGLASAPSRLAVCTHCGRFLRVCEGPTYQVLEEADLAALPLNERLNLERIRLIAQGVHWRRRSAKTEEDAAARLRYVCELLEAISTHLRALPGLLPPSRIGVHGRLSAEITTADQAVTRARGLLNDELAPGHATH